MNDLKKLYKKIIFEKESNSNEINKDYWRLGYHLMAPVGWLNDPNGLCEFKENYHVFYQYSPTEVKGGLKFWGHYTTKDFINWERHEVAIYPDQVFDLHGVFSGSTFIENDKMYCYYTGTVMREGYNGNYEIEGMEQNTILVTSEDGFTFSDKKLLLTNEDYPNMSWHVRDPKVWKEDDTYFMVLGGRNKESEGCVLIYESSDKINWKYLNTIKSNKNMGYMWECPDIFYLDDKKILLTCPQGMPLNGEDIVNIHQCGYFIINGDIKNQSYDISDFHTLDWGFDFYAPQSFVDSKGRRILLGWLSISDTTFGYPTIEKGWNHCLSIPRELAIKDDKLIQKPIEELKNLRKEKIEFEVKNGEINKDLSGDKYELIINLDKNIEDINITLRNDIKLVYTKNNNEFKLILSESGYGRKERKIKIETLKGLRVFMDTSALEIFINDGSYVLSSRVFPKENDKEIRIEGKGLNLSGVMYTLNDFEIKKI